MNARSLSLVLAFALGLTGCLSIGDTASGRYDLDSHVAIAVGQFGDISLTEHQNGGFDPGRSRPSSAHIVAARSLSPQVALAEATENGKVRVRAISAGMAEVEVEVGDGTTDSFQIATADPARCTMQFEGLGPSDLVHDASEANFMLLTKLSASHGGALRAEQLPHYASPAQQVAVEPSYWSLLNAATVSTVRLDHPQSDVAVASETRTCDGVEALMRVVPTAAIDSVHLSFRTFSNTKGQNIDLPSDGPLTAEVGEYVMTKLVPMAGDAPVHYAALQVRSRSLTPDMCHVGGYIAEQNSVETFYGTQDFYEGMSVMGDTPGLCKVEFEVLGADGGAGLRFGFEVTYR